MWETMPYHFLKIPFWEAYTRITGCRFSLNAAFNHSLYVKMSRDYSTIDLGTICIMFITALTEKRRQSHIHSHKTKYFTDLM